MLCEGVIFRLTVSIYFLLEVHNMGHFLGRRKWRTRKKKNTSSQQSMMKKKGNREQNHFCNLLLNTHEKDRH